MRWGCYAASSIGLKQVDAQGNNIGCDVGKQIRDELALETLSKVIKSIPVDFDWMIQNLTNIVLSVIQSEEDTNENPDRLKKQIEQLQQKKETTIDAFVSGFISKEELQQMKARYDEEIEPLQKKLNDCKMTKKPTASQLHADIKKRIESIITCKEFAEPFYKALLQTLVVHKDGTLDYKINHLPQTWIYRLEYQKENPE